PSFPQCFTTIAAAYCRSHPPCCSRMFRPPPRSTPFPYTTLFRSAWASVALALRSAEILGWMIQLMFLLVGWHYAKQGFGVLTVRSEEHTSELQSRENLVCRLLLEKKNRKYGLIMQARDRTRFDRQ